MEKSNGRFGHTVFVALVFQRVLWLFLICNFSQFMEIQNGKNSKLGLGIVIGICAILIWQSATSGELRSLWEQFNYKVIHRAEYKQAMAKAYQYCLARTDKEYVGMGITNPADPKQLEPQYYQTYLRLKQENIQVCNNTYKK
jgi:hypothetical protein